MTNGHDRIDAIPDRELSPGFLPPQTIRGHLRRLPESLFSGEDPREFARTMGIVFAYGERRFLAREDGRPGGMAILLLRDELPEALRAGFGGYGAATLHTRGGPPEVVLHEQALLAGIEWSRMLPEEPD